MNRELHPQSLCFRLHNATNFNIKYLLNFKFVRMCCLFVFFCFGGAYSKRMCISIFYPKKVASSNWVLSRQAEFPIGGQLVGGGGGHFG